MLSYSLWQTQFGGNPSIVGRTVGIAGQPHTVVGVTSREFAGSEGRSRIWVPLASIPVLRPGDTGLDRPQDCCAEIYGRVNPGVTRVQVEAELQTLSDRFRAMVGQEARPLVLGGTQALRGRRGDRVALGARSADVIRVVLSGSARVVVLGLGMGVVGAVAASQLLRSMLFGLSPIDPLTYGSVALVLAAAAMVASYVPARRALRVNAATTLRAE